MVVLETRIGTEGETLRMRRAGNGHYVLEHWHRATATWKNLEEHAEFYIVLHSFFDEVCKRSEKLRRDMEANGAEKK